MRIAMSPAAAGLLRALAVRTAVDRDRFLLTEIRSCDWQSLTFIGERHQFQLRVTGEDAASVMARMLSGLEDSEFEIPGHLVADIAVAEPPRRSADGSMLVDIEALTVAVD